VGRVVVMRQTILRIVLGPLSACLLMITFGQAQTPPGSDTGFDTLAKRAEEASSADHLNEAVSLYKKALALRPDWGKGWSSLARIEYNRRNYREAREAILHIVQVSANDGNATALLGLC